MEWSGLFSFHTFTSHRGKLKYEDVDHGACGFPQLVKWRMWDLNPVLRARALL